MGDLKEFRSKEENEWLRSLSNFQEPLYNEFVNKIRDSEEKGEQEGNNKFESIKKKLEKNEYTITDLYEFIIKSKHDYNQSISTEFYFIYKYLKNKPFSRKLEGSSYEKLAKVGYDFFYHYKFSGFYKVENFIEDFCKEVFNYNSTKVLYDSSLECIRIINNELFDSNIKLPSIENVELEIFHRFIKEDEDKTIRIEKLENYYREILKNRDEEIDKNEKEIDIIKEKLRSIESSKLKLEVTVEVYEEKMVSMNNYVELLLNEIHKKDFQPVSQYDELYWGDNYPALKVLFNFLQKYYVIDFNWSYFASLMCEGNKEVINLSTQIVKKTELGFLLNGIKPFYKNDYNNTKKRYNNILKRKFHIDYLPIDDKFISNYVRENGISKQRLEMHQILKDLLLNIANKYK